MSFISKIQRKYLLLAFISIAITSIVMPYKTAEELSYQKSPTTALSITSSKLLQQTDYTSQKAAQSVNGNISDFTIADVFKNPKRANIGQLGRPEVMIGGIKVGKFPVDVSVNPATNTIYVANSASYEVSVINGTTNQVMKPINVGGYQYGIAVNPKTSRVYVAADTAAEGTEFNTISVIDSRTNKELTNITVGESPSAIAVDPNTNTIYVANGDSKSVSVIDGSTNKVTANITVGKFPQAIAVDPNTNTIYIASSDTHTVSVINGTTNQVMELITVGSDIRDVAVNPETSRVYVTFGTGPRIFMKDSQTNSTTIVYGNSSAQWDAIAVNPETNGVYVATERYDNYNTVSAIDGRTNKQLTDVAVGKLPKAIAVNPATNRIYVANKDSNTISVIQGSANNISTRPASQNHLRGQGIKVDSNASAIAVNPATNKIYVANFGNTISVIDGSIDKVMSYIQVGNSPSSIAVNPKTSMVYMNTFGNTISVIDGRTNKELTNITVGEYAFGIAVDPSTNKIYVANGDSKSVSVIDGSTNKVTSNITVEESPFGIAVDPNTSRVYVTNLYSNAISVIDGEKNRVLAHIKIDKPPCCIVLTGEPLNAIAVAPNTNKIYVAKPDSSAISVIDPDIGSEGTVGRIVANVTVGEIPQAISVNPNTNRIYVANRDSNTISVIQGSTDKLVTSIPVGPDPVGVSVNPNTNRIYVANRGSGNVSVIDGSINNVIAGISFEIVPANAGHITCNGKEIPPKDYIRIGVGTNCIANPNTGFQFSSWSEDLGHNSSRTIITTMNSNSYFSSLSSRFCSLSSWFCSNDNSTTFTVSQYGNYTANFGEIPPPLPKEYSLSLFGIMVSVVAGWLIPNIARWLNSRRQSRHLGKYMTIIDALNDNTSYQNKDEYLQRLNHIKREIAEMLTKRNITESQYGILNDKILYYEKKINSKL